MTKKTKILIGVAAVVVIAVVAGASMVKGRSAKGTKVRTATAGRADLVSLITANGTIQATTKVDLSANIMGQITRLAVEEGQEVREGDLLLVIDQIRYRAAVASARSNLASLEAELERAREAAAQARRDQARSEQQLREGILPAAEHERLASLFDQSRASVRRVERQVEQARADLDATQDSFAKTEIRAPMSGIVTSRNVEQGEVVVTGTMNNPGTVLLTISDMSKVEAVLEVDQTDVPRLRVGQRAQVMIDAFPERPFAGQVSEIGSSPIRGTSMLGGAATGTDYQVKVTLLEHPDGVRPGLSVTADITTATRERVVTVPIGALVLRSPESSEGNPAATPAPGAVQAVSSRAREIEGVYVVEAGKAAFREVSTGIKGELDVEVIDGLTEGDEVIVGPFRALREIKPGDDVTVDNSERAGSR